MALSGGAAIAAQSLLSFTVDHGSCESRAMAPIRPTWPGNSCWANVEAIREPAENCITLMLLMLIESRIVSV